MRGFPSPKSGGGCCSSNAAANDAPASSAVHRGAPAAAFGQSQLEQRALVAGEHVLNPTHDGVEARFGAAIF